MQHEFLEGVHCCGSGSAFSRVFFLSCLRFFVCGVEVAELLEDRLKRNSELAEVRDFPKPEI